MEQNKKTLMISLIFGLIILIFIFVLIYPILKGINKDSNNLSNLEKESISLEDQMNNIEEIRATYEASKNDFEKIENLFINSEVPIDFIKFLEQTAVTTNVSIDILPVSQEKLEEKKWNFMNFQISTIGSFVNFVRFLEKIENSMYLLETKNLIIKRSNIKTIVSDEYVFSNEVNASLLIKVYAK